MADPVDPVAAQNALAPTPTSIVIKTPDTTSEAPPAPPKADPNRPAGLPPKFKTTDDLIKAYGELEKRLSGGKPTDPPAKPADQATPPAADPKDLSIKAAEKAVTDAGLNFNEFTAEFTEKGALSPESYAKLEAKGLTKEIVDIHIQGLQALQERTVETMLKDVGGREGYQKIAEWAAANIPKDELEAYNRAVTSSDQAIAKLALQGLHAKYSSSQEPDFLRKGEAIQSKGDVFRSTAELTDAIRNPKYKTDPAYRADVAAKLKRSEIM